MSSGLKRNGPSVPSLPPPQPKSPPRYPDLYGKRRELARVQMLEREFGFLEEEIKSMEGLQPASRSCKEVVDFVTANADPLMPTTKKIRRSRRFWKWLCGVLYVDVSWIWCCSCRPRLSCDCIRCSCPSSCSTPCTSCRVAEWFCFSCGKSRCFKNWKCCSLSCCCSGSCCCVSPKCPNCPACSFPRCACCCPKCPSLNICSCRKSCCHCYPCFYCM